MASSCGLVCVTASTSRTCSPRATPPRVRHASPRATPRATSVPRTSALATPRATPRTSALATPRVLAEISSPPKVSGGGCLRMMLSASSPILGGLSLAESAAVGSSTVSYAPEISTGGAYVNAQYTLLQPPAVTPTSVAARVTHSTLTPMCGSARVHAGPARALTSYSVSVPASPLPLPARLASEACVISSVPTRRSLGASTLSPAMSEPLLITARSLIESMEACPAPQHRIGSTSIIAAPSSRDQSPSMQRNVALESLVGTIQRNLPLENLSRGLSLPSRESTRTISPLARALAFEQSREHMHTQPAKVFGCATERLSCSPRVRPPPVSCSGRMSLPGPARRASTQPISAGYHSVGLPGSPAPPERSRPSMASRVPMAPQARVVNTAESIRGIGVCTPPSPHPPTGTCTLAPAMSEPLLLLTARAVMEPVAAYPPARATACTRTASPARDPTPQSDDRDVLSAPGGTGAANSGDNLGGHSGGGTGEACLNPASNRLACATVASLLGAFTGKNSSSGGLDTDLRDHAPQRPNKSSSGGLDTDLRDHAPQRPNEPAAQSSDAGYEHEYEDLYEDFHGEGLQKRERKSTLELQSAEAAVEKYFRRCQKARELKKEEPNLLRISAKRWDNWDDGPIWVDSSGGPILESARPGVSSARKGSATVVAAAPRLATSARSQPMKKTRSDSDIVLAGAEEPTPPDTPVRASRDALRRSSPGKSPQQSSRMATPQFAPRKSPRQKPNIGFGGRHDGPPAPSPSRSPRKFNARPKASSASSPLSMVKNSKPSKNSNLPGSASRSVPSNGLGDVSPQGGAPDALDCGAGAHTGLGAPACNTLPQPPGLDVEQALARHLSTMPATKTSMSPQMSPEERERMSSATVAMLQAIQINDKEKMLENLLEVVRQIAAGDGKQVSALSTPVSIACQNTAADPEAAESPPPPEWPLPSDFQADWFPGSDHLR